MEIKSKGYLTNIIITKKNSLPGFLVDYKKLFDKKIYLPELIFLDPKKKNKMKLNQINKKSIYFIVLTSYEFFGNNLSRLNNINSYHMDECQFIKEDENFENCKTLNNIKFWTGTPVQNELLDIQRLFYCLMKDKKFFDIKEDKMYEFIKKNFIVYFKDDNRKFLNIFNLYYF
jgi:hypothetical protein